MRVWQNTYPARTRRVRRNSYVRYASAGYGYGYEVFEPVSVYTRTYQVFSQLTECANAIIVFQVPVVIKEVVGLVRDRFKVMMKIALQQKRKRHT